jgi:hypothetical protein
MVDSLIRRSGAVDVGLNIAHEGWPFARLAPQLDGAIRAAGRRRLRTPAARDGGVLT